MTLTNVAFCNTAPCLNCIHRSYCGTDLMSNQKATKSAAGTPLWPARYNVFNVGKKEGVSDSIYFCVLGGWDFVRVAGVLCPPAECAIV